MQVFHFNCLLLGQFFNYSICLFISFFMRNQPVNHIFLQNLVFAERPSAEERICFAYIE